jgi:anti-anti-sigma regulatory factor
MKASKRKRATAPKEDPAADSASGAASILQSEPPQQVVQERIEAPTQSAAVVTLYANCSVRDVVALRSQLLDVIDSAAAVIIDAAQLERIDTAALQVLAAFVRDRRKQQQEVLWLNVNDALSEAAQTLGLLAALGIPEAQAEAA